MVAALQTSQVVIITTGSSEALTGDVEERRGDEQWVVMRRESGTCPVARVKVKQLSQGHVPLQLAHVVRRRQWSVAIL